MVHLGVFDLTLRKTRLSELPREVIPAVFEDVGKRYVFVWVAEVVENIPSQGHVDHIAEPIEVRRRAEQDATRPQNLSETLKNNVAGDGQMLDDFGEEHEVELLREGRVR